MGCGKAEAPKTQPTAAPATVSPGASDAQEGASADKPEAVLVDKPEEVPADKPEAAQPIAATAEHATGPLRVAASELEATAAPMRAAELQADPADPAVRAKALAAAVDFLAQAGADVEGLAALETTGIEVVVVEKNLDADPELEAVVEILVGFEMAKAGCDTSDPDDEEPGAAAFDYLVWFDRAGDAYMPVGSVRYAEACTASTSITKLELGDGPQIFRNLTSGAYFDLVVRAAVEAGTDGYTVEAWSMARGKAERLLSEATPWKDAETFSDETPAVLTVAESAEDGVEVTKRLTFDATTFRYVVSAAKTAEP